MPRHTPAIARDRSFIRQIRQPMIADPLTRQRPTLFRRRGTLPRRQRIAVLDHHVEMHAVPLLVPQNDKRHRLLR